MAKLSYKVSYNIFYALCALTVVLFGAFYVIGFDNINADGKNEPLLTDVLMIFMFLMVLGTIAVTLWGGINSIRESSSKGESIDRVPSKKVVLAAIGSLVGSLVIGLILGLGETEYKAADGTITTAGWVTVADMFIWSIIILSVITIIATVVNMVGFKKK